MGLAVLDTSVLIAALDRDDLHHQTARQAVHRARRIHDLVIPVVAYAEAMTGAIAQGPSAERIVDGFSTRIANVVPLDPPTARRGAALRAAHGLSLPDAMILGTAIELDADVVLTADRRWKNVDARVELV